MTKQELIKSLSDVQDDEQVWVDVTLYDDNDQQCVHTKRFRIMSVSRKGGKTAISVQAPDQDPWTSLEGGSEE